MKRQIALLIGICIIFLTSATVAGSGTPKIYCDTVQCNSGETVPFSVHISNNTGLSAFLISIGCESDWLYFDETAVQGDFTDKGSMESSCDGRQLNVMWYDNDGVCGDGTLFTVDVHISPSAPSGDYPIKIAYSPENTLDKELNPLGLEASTGCITVAHISDTVPVDEENTSAGEDNIPWIIGISAAAGAAVVTVIIAAKKKKQKTHN